MKSYLLLVLTLFTFHPTSAQTDNQAIKKSFEEYLKAVEQNDFKKIVDNLYPKLFKIAPKETMLKAMSEISVDTTITTIIHSSALKNISKILVLENIKYALINYSFKITMLFKKDNDAEALDFTCKILQGKYGEKNVVFDKEKNTIEISVNSAMYVINDPAYSGWTFLEKKEEMKPILEKLLPKKVLKKL